MSHDLDIIQESGNYRVRLEYDQDAEQPYNDGATPIFMVKTSSYGGYSVEAFNSQADNYVSAVSEILERHDWLTLERFVRIFYGAVKLDSFYSDGLRGYYVAFDTADWREETGAPIESLKTEDYLSEVKAWADGDVYGYIIERRVSGQKVYDADDIDAEDFDEWIDVESCWGFYGRQWAEQSAREALAAVLETGSSNL